MADEHVMKEIKQEPADQGTNESPAWRVLWELPPQVSHGGDDDSQTDSPPAKATEESMDTEKRQPACGEKKQLRIVPMKTEPKDIGDYESTDPMSQGSTHDKDHENDEEMMNVAVVKSEPDICEESDSLPNDQESSGPSRKRLRSGRGSNLGVKSSLEQEHENSGKKTKLDTGVGQRVASTSPYPVCLIKSVGEGHESHRIYRHGSPELDTYASTSTENNREKKRSAYAEVYFDNAEDGLCDSSTDYIASSKAKARRDCTGRQHKSGTTPVMAQTSSENISTGSEGEEQNDDVITRLLNSVDAVYQSEEKSKQAREKLTHLLRSRGKTKNQTPSEKTDNEVEVYVDNAEDNLSCEATGEDTQQQDIPLTDPCKATSQQSCQLMKGKQGKKQKDSLTKIPAGSTMRHILPKVSEDHLTQGCQPSSTGEESPRKPIAVKSTIYVNRRRGPVADLYSPSKKTVGYLVNDDTSLASDSKDVVYEDCGCTHQSLFERAEIEAWRMVKLPGKGYDSSIQMKNLGLVRFMNRPLFTFTKDDKLYVYLAEVKFKKLLPLFEHEQNYLCCDAVWKLIAPEVRKPNLVEQVYVENYIYMESGHWICVMITPHGLHLMYQLLHKRKTFGSQPQPLRWYKHAHALFYQQKLGHQCPWTLLVTPPTDCEPAKKRSSYTSSSVHKVMKTLTRVHWDPETKQQRLEEVKLCDGGAGTAIDSHQLSPLLGSALSSLIKLFHLEDIAEPFCTCSLSVSDTHLYQPLTINHTVFRHITEVSFVDFPSPLHCWKRNNGFYVSYVEFSQKTLLPPLGDAEVESLLNAAAEGTDVCFMLEPEMLFLTRVQVSKGGKKTVNPDSVDAIIERAKDCMHEKNVKKGRCKNSAARSNNLGLLINLLYLRKMYVKLAKTHDWLKPHASAKFFIKHWLHDCPSEKYSSFSSSRTEPDDEGDVLDSADNIREPSSPYWCQPADDEDNDEVDDKTDEGEADEDETSSAKKDSSKVEEAVDGEDDDLEMVEHVSEEEKEVIDLVESSSDEDQEDSDLGLEHCNPHRPTEAFKEQVKETGTSNFNQQGKATKQRKDKTATGPQEMKQTNDPKQKTCGPDRSNDDLDSTSRNVGSAGHDLSSTSHDSQDSSHSRVMLGSLKVSGIKREKPEGMDSSLMNLDHIKREVTDTDEYFSNLPIAIVADLQEGGTPSKQAVPVAEPSSAEKYDADIVQQIKREQGQQMKKQASSAQKKKAEVDSDDDDDSDDEEAVSFKLESYLRSCTCPEDSEKSVLTSHSILQSSINQRNAISILNHVNQAVIGDNLVFTFTHNNSIFMNVGQLQDLGFIKQNIMITSYTHQCPAHWLQKMSALEINFLVNNGITMNPARAYLLSAELLSFLSYERRSVVRCMIRKSDICLHRIGHICPKPRSIARQVLTNSLYLDIVMQAWAKSWTWQDNLKEVERRRLAGTQPLVTVKADANRHKASVMERALTYAEPRFTDARDIGLQKGKGSMKVKSKSTYADSSCALYLRKYKFSDLDVSDATANSRNSKSTFYVCSPNFMGGVNIVKRKTVTGDGKAKDSGKVKGATPTEEGSQDKDDQETNDEEKEGESTDDDKDHQTNILEGAMLPKSFKDKNQCLKSGVGFAELDTAAIESWIGNKSETHHLVLTGTLTTGIRQDGEPFTFGCMRIKDKLYINWGELCMQMVGIGTIYRLARQLHIFLYSIPTILGLHFSRHYGSCMDTMSSKPWLCVNSINAVAWLGVIDTVSCNMFPKTFTLLDEHFQDTDNWNLQFRNFLLIPKAEFVPM